MKTTLRPVLVLSVALFSLFFWSGPATLNAQQPCFPEISAGEDIYVDCGEELPPFSACTGSSDCCGTAEISSFTSATAELVRSCDLTTAHGPGPDWAFWFPDMDAQNVSWIFDGPGMFEEYADGTAHLWGHISKESDPSQGFDVHLWMHNGQNWDSWSALGRGYKDDLNLAADNYEDWTYYELVPGFAWLNGTGALEGSQIQLTHFPVNYYFGFQAGIGANNRNGNEGLSGWFEYTGWMNGEWVEGHGDVNVDRACTDAPAGCTNYGGTQVCRATNDCGLSSYAWQTIASIDNVAPVIDEFESPITLNCFDYDGVFITAADDCSEITITYTDEVVEEGCNGLVIRHYVVVDACGNVSTADQWIQLTGGVPEFTSFPEDTEVECGDVPPADTDLVTYSDGCANTTLTIDEEIIPGDCPGNYTIIRVYTLTDDCDHLVSQTWTIGVEDTTAPELFNIPADATLSCGDPIPDALVFALDNCSESPLIGVSATTVPLDCGYQFVRTWFAVDDCGNTSEGTQVITVTDNLPPVFTFVPEDVVLSCGTQDDIAPAIADDECSSFVVEISDEPFEGDCSGGFVRTYTATDGCGNSASVSHTITFNDDVAPYFISFPDDINVACGDVPTAESAGIEFADDCSAVSVELAESITTGDCPGSVTIERTWTLTDACGNSTSQTWTISTSDNEGPTLFGIPEDITIACGEEISDAVVVAIDNCTAQPLVGLSAETIPAECGYLFVRTWTAFDDCGNVSTGSQTITVEDTSSPYFTVVPEPVTISCGDALPAPSAVAEDDCTEVQILVSDVTLDDCAGSVMRTYTAIDACGNSSTVEQLITRIDNSAPFAVDFPQDVTVDCTNVPSLEDVTVQFVDDCGSVEVSFSESTIEGSCPNTWTTIYTWTATDGCGNSVAQSWTVTVADTEGPVFVNVSEDLELECGDELPEGSAEAFDSCSGLLDLTSEETVEELDCGYQVIRTWTATDNCGNVSTATQTIFFNDTTDPYFLDYPGDITINCDDPVPAVVLPVAVDACDTEVPTELAEEIYPLDCGGYYIQRVFRAFDDCGNQAIWAQNVYVIDTEGPVFTHSPESLEITCSEAGDVFVEIEDACHEATLNFNDEVISDNGCETLIERTYTATDECGNESIFVQTILVADVFEPTFVTFPSDVTVSCDEIPSIDNSGVSWSDDCTNVDVDVTEETIAGDCANSYLLIRMWTITDGCGNSASQQWNITVVDTEAPVLIGVPADITIDCGDDVPDAIVIGQDNCSGSTEVGLSAITEPTDCGYIFTRTWFTFDDCGNETSATQVVTAIDMSPPVLSEYPENIEINCGDEIPAPAFITATDNCSGEVDVDFQETSFGTGECDDVIERTWCAFDCAGNSVCWTQTITTIGNAPGLANQLTVVGQNDEQITLRYTFGESGRATVRVFDATGAIIDVPSEASVNAGAPSQVTIQTTGLASGIYVVRISNQEVTMTRSFAVIR